MKTLLSLIVPFGALLCLPACAGVPVSAAPLSAPSAAASKSASTSASKTSAARAVSPAALRDALVMLSARAAREDIPLGILRREFEGHGFVVREMAQGGQGAPLALHGQHVATGIKVFAQAFGGTFDSPFDALRFTFPAKNAMHDVAVAAIGQAEAALAGADVSRQNLPRGQAWGFATGKRLAVFARPAEGVVTVSVEFDEEG